MNCESFSLWLENRDTHDISEADRAKRHAAGCGRCRTLLEKDEMLDRALSMALAGGQVPESLRQGVDISLERTLPGRKRGGLLAAVSAACLVIALIFSFSLQQNFASMDELGKYVLEGHLDHGSHPEFFEPVGDASVWLADMVGESVRAPLHVPAGYRVVGARFCTLGHCQAVHMIYDRDGSTLSVFVVAEGEIGFHMENGRTYSVNMTGSRVTFWKQDHQVFAVAG